MDNLDHNLNLDTQHRREILQKSIDESKYQKLREDLKKLIEKYTKKANEDDGQ